MCAGKQHRTELHPIPGWRDLNSFIYLDPKFAASIGRVRTDVGSAAGQLSGYWLAIKDNIDVVNMPTTCGTPSLRRNVVRRSASAVEMLCAAGASVVGKTNMHELAFGITSNNAAFGPVHNVFDIDSIAGGSSGGTAAAIAAGVVHAGLGTDTGGSARIPAALNGIVGFRPTVGRYPMGGVARICPTRDVIGPMGRTVHDIVLLDSVLCAHSDAEVQEADLCGLRIGLPGEHFQESLHPDVARTLRDVVARLRRAGVVFVEKDLKDIAALNAAVGFPVVLRETRAALTAYLDDCGLDMTFAELCAGAASADVREILAQVAQEVISEEAYRHALREERPRIQRLYEEYFASHCVEAVLFPTTPLPACPIDGCDRQVSLNGVRVPTFATYIRNTDPGSNAGIPGISLPAGFSLGPETDAKRLPIGVELDGPAGSDRRLLSIAAAVEGVLSQNPFNA